MNCPNCGMQTVPGAAFCDNCGTALTGRAATPSNLPPTTAISGTCPQCGRPVMPGEAFCDNCGSALNMPVSSPPPPMAAAPAPQPAAWSPAAPSGGSQSCPSCGQLTTPGTAFCDNCGASLSAPTAAAVPPVSPPPAWTPPPAVPPAATQQCPNCGAAATPGAAFCDNCGASLSGTAVPPPPINYQQSPQPGYPPQYPPVQPPVVTGPPPRLVVQATNQSIPFPGGKVELLVGREDPVSNVFPEIDFEPHGGDEGGVSRRHAKFTLQGSQWYITDLQSTNFTFVNKEKLQPNQPHLLNNGDEVRLGRVITRFHAA